MKPSKVRERSPDDLPIDENKRESPYKKKKINEDEPFIESKQLSPQPPQQQDVEEDEEKDEDNLNILNNMIPDISIYNPSKDNLNTPYIQTSPSSSVQLPSARQGNDLLSDNEMIHYNPNQLICSPSIQQSQQQTNSREISNPNMNFALSSIYNDDSTRYVDITKYLNMPQSQAAEKLGIPTSTLSKRWKEVARNRKWPYRTVSKLDKEIMAILHNIPQGSNKLQPDMEATLGVLLRRRQEELRPVRIRL